VPAVRRRRARQDGDDPGQVAPVVDPGASREEVDPVERRFAEDGGAVEQVVQDRDALPVDVRARVFRPRSSHEELAAGERRPGDSGKELDDAHRVLVRAGDVAELLARELGLRRRIASPLAGHEGGELSGLGAVEIHGDRARLSGHDADAGLSERVLGGVDEQLLLARGKRERRVAECIGRAAAVRAPRR